jgi:PAS domain S-box-containing protein
LTGQGQAFLVAILLAYLGFLFLIAYLAEAFGRKLQAPRLRTATYVLAISVYCTAWTFYGSVGLAAHRGLEFLTIYLGPALVAVVWPTVLRKLVRVAKEQRITTISDFVASRYGKSAPLGTLVAIFVVCGMIPYIALQLKAVSLTFRMMIPRDSVLSGFDPTLLVAATLALFVILFGARNLDFTRQQTGLMTAVAVESIVKLVAFVLVGGFVTWGLFSGFGDIFGRVAVHPEWSRLLVLDQAPAASYARWTAMLLISMMAVMLLPRQFHVLVVQNPRECDVQTAAWAFPLYLLAINVFVLPIAFAGLLQLGDLADADSFVLALPLRAGAHFVATAVFLGGFSAATAMIVVDSLALSKMISNDIVLPVLLRRRRVEEVYWTSLASTRLGILVVVGLGFLWARVEAGQFLLVEMGLLSFIAVSQCAPAVFLGLYWRRGNRNGALAAISTGFALWFYTLIIPTFVKEGVVSRAFLDHGPLGLGFLRPTAVLGLEGLDPLTHGVFWSLLLNVAVYCLVSIFTTQDADERSQAAAFVGVAEAEPARTPAILSVPEIERLIHLYVPAEEADAILGELLDGKATRELSRPDLLDLRIRLERMLAASLGAAAARYIIEDRFTISKGEAQELVESFQDMQRSLRRSERLLASVVESVEDCIFTTDLEGRVITFNAAGQALLGYPAGVPGVTSLDILDEADRRRAGPGIQRAVAEGRPWRGTVGGLTRAGRRFPAHLAISCVFDAQRRVLGTVGVLRDLTEQVATQQRLIQREKLASLGEMAAGVAHEIRNPLGGIKMATDLLSSGGFNDPRISQEMAQSVLSGIAEIETIVAELLDYARDTRLDLQEYPLARILAPVVEGGTTEGQARGVTFLAHGLDLDLVATVDGQRLRRVFANVVKNALEATERCQQGRIEISLSVRGSAAIVEVADNGVGMRAEDRDKIFLPFYTTKPTGTGLGMAIVKKIMDLHGGEIEIDSTPGRGTTVRLVIPQARVATAVAS